MWLRLCCFSLHSCNTHLSLMYLWTARRFNNNETTTTKKKSESDSRSPTNISSVVYSSARTRIVHFFFSNPSKITAENCSFFFFKHHSFLFLSEKQFFCFYPHLCCAARDWRAQRCWAPLWCVALRHRPTALPPLLLPWTPLSRSQATFMRTLCRRKRRALCSTQRRRAAFPRRTWRRRPPRRRPTTSPSSSLRVVAEAWLPSTTARVATPAILTPWRSWLALVVTTRSGCGWSCSASCASWQPLARRCMATSLPSISSSSRMSRGLLSRIERAK